MLLNTKEEVKYFLATIGDCMYEKNPKLIYYVSEMSRDFITEIESYYKDFFGKMLYNNQYKFKYRGAEYNNSRIIMFKKTITNKTIWNTYLKKNFINLLVVSAHYSNRYGDSDVYIKKQPDELQNKIFYLKNNSKEDIIMEFKKKMLHECEESTINNKNMYFLWKIFCDSKNIPVILYKNDIIDLLKGDLSCDTDAHTFNNVKSDYLEPAKNFSKFWESEIKVGCEIDEEFEISEICELYTIWLKAKKDINYTIIKEYQLKNLLMYFYPNTKMEGKYLYNLSCNLWDKRGDIRTCLKNKFNKKIDKDMSILEAYKSYCSYGDNNNYVNIVSKQYFMKYICKIIPQENMKNNYILLEYWN